MHDDPGAASGLHAKPGSGAAAAATAEAEEEVEVVKNNTKPNADFIFLQSECSVLRRKRLRAKEELL